MTARAETKTLIAREIALFNQVSPVRLFGDNQLLSCYLNVAENILATVERKMHSIESDDLSDGLNLDWVKK